MIDTLVSVYRFSLLTGLHSRPALVRNCPGVCVWHVTSPGLEVTLSGVMSHAEWDVSPALSAEAGGAGWAE